MINVVNVYCFIDDTVELCSSYHFNFILFHLDILVNCEALFELLHSDNRHNLMHYSIFMEERQSLLSPTSLLTSGVTEEQVGCSKKWGSCKLSKAAIALIIFHAVVGASYASFVNVAMWLGYSNGNVSMTVIIGYSLVAIIALLSPLSGFLADVYCGRYRVVHAGLCLICGSLLLLSFNAILTMTLGVTIWNSHHGVIHGCVLFTCGCSYLFFVTGHSNYRTNIIQFGLDQLLDAPSSSLALFIHWLVWAENLGTFIIQICFAMFICNQNSRYTPKAGCSLPLVLMICFFLIIVCLRKRWFYSEQQHNNPYKMVFKVLNFAKRHHSPLQRSAFTYCDDEQPSRLDFGKERYGGPFTTEQVEDVKTLLKILGVLLALGLLFILEIPSSIFLSILFGLHVGGHTSVTKQACSGRFIFLGKGSMMNLVTVSILPLYLKFVHHRIPRILSRLILAGSLYLIGVASMLCIDLAGHIITNKNAIDNTGTMCMFTVPHHNIALPSLNLSSGYLLIPDILIGIGSPLVMATAFEFISAQSPSAMKGLLVGVFFSIRAFFELISGVALMPFSYRPIWDSRHMREHPPATNCCFGYLCFTCVVALVGLLLLGVVVRRYKNRERDDRPYDQRFAVDVYSRYLA